MPEAHATEDSGFRSSSYCGPGDCVAVKLNCEDGLVRVRHSRHGEQGTLIFSASEWRAFIAGVHNHEFDN